MPEGDTIHRAAERLRPCLEGQELRRFRGRVQGERPRAGRRITGVEAVGKHLLIRFDDGLVLRTHMRMTGSWHVHKPGERWRRPPHLARAVLEVDDCVAVCFAAPVVTTYREGQRSGIEHLGPDLCSEEPDIDGALRRMDEIAAADEEIANVLLDQRVAAGIGNAVKCEALWACRQSPFTTLADVEPERRRRLLVTAAKHLRHGLLSERPVAVHGRNRKPCRVCGTPIRLARQGTRVTYWCPTCQPGE